MSDLELEMLPASGHTCQYFLQVAALCKLYTLSSEFRLTCNATGCAATFEQPFAWTARSEALATLQKLEMNRLGKRHQAAKYPVAASLLAVQIMQWSCWNLVTGQLR